MERLAHFLPRDYFSQNYESPVPPYTILMNSDGSYFAVATVGSRYGYVSDYVDQAYLWNIETDEVEHLASANGSRGGICPMAISESMLAYTNESNIVMLYNLSSPHDTQLLPNVPSCSRLQFSPDGHTLVVLQYPEATFFDIETGEELATISSDTSPYDQEFVFISGNSQAFVYVADRTLQLRRIRP